MHRVKKCKEILSFKKTGTENLRSHIVYCIHINIPARGRAPDRQETTAEKGGRAMDISSAEGGHERGRVRGDSDGHQEEAEYGRAIHCDATDSVLL